MAGISLSASRADGFYNPPDWDPGKIGRDHFQVQQPCAAPAQTPESAALLFDAAPTRRVYVLHSKGGCKSLAGLTSLRFVSGVEGAQSV
jgi:hypothetical protein